MATESLRQRRTPVVQDKSNLDAKDGSEVNRPHPAGEVKHGPAVQLIRLLLFTTWFVASSICINVTQWIGSPLYFVNKDYFYAYMALTKQSFGIVCALGTRWFSRTLVRVSWDASLRGQLRKTADGRLETSFPERLVLVANHQIYTDWLYFWWMAYTSRMHGHIFIILKESLKYIPFFGQGMMFYGFIFLSRKWVSDKPRLQHRLEKLKSRHTGPMSGSQQFDPMWLLIFPEGTNLSANTRTYSAKWAEKQGIADLKNELLPRSTGLLFCLQELQGTVDWIYDCTVAYEGTPKGGYAAEYFTLRSTYFQGRPPKSVNMYWRRFAMSSIPLSDSQSFEDWLTQRWKEKDALLERYYDTGRFPSDLQSSDEQAQIKDGYIDTEVKLQNWYEIGQVFMVLATLALVANVITKLFEMFS